MEIDSLRNNVTCKPRFVKVYIPDVHSEKMMIPTKFSQKFGAELSDVVTLSVGGHIWKVELLKTEENIYFHVGWPEFLDHYKLQYGYIVVFSYRGLSNFHVHIFDLTTCEVNNVYDDRPIGEINDRNNHDNQTSVTDLEKDDFKPGDAVLIPSTSKQRDYSRKRPRQVTENVNDLSNLKRIGCADRNLDVSMINNGSLAKMPDAGKVYELPVIVGKSFLRECERLSENGKKQVSKARLFKSENPSFLVFASQINNAAGKMYVPAEFVKKYLPSDMKSIIVQDLSGTREWSFQIEKRTSGCLFLTKGWSRFSRENGLKREDFCIFERLKIMSDVFLLRVSIFRTVVSKTSTNSEKDHIEIVGGENFSKKCEKLSKRGKRAVSAAKLLKPENPSFMVILGKNLSFNSAMVS
ncbi:B3 domain-containing transcription factor VRN1-like [Rutidosis leptorrhynchoides]|uniref:B3 domain-containing transcription factor VRN1-like n=1 Tax=Rutidosis leptorrhynchoides TaxID=125765 RepID=UPI003A99DD98